MDWFQLRLLPDAQLSQDEVDAVCHELIEHGAAGTTIEEDGVISCFVSGSDSEAREVEHLAASRGLRVVSREMVGEENWTQQCPELWDVVEAGCLRVVPVQSLDDSSAHDERTIKIIPGQGFGTGHHPTTRMILETLSTLPPNVAPEGLSILDLGTGSGILAIAAAKLFNQRVEAIDNDPVAIDNARDNVNLNNLTDLVTLSTTPLESLTASYNLILANVYGEVLTRLAPDVTRRALPGCTAILSGITELVRDTVIDAYEKNGAWVVHNERHDSGWHCVTLIRQG